LVITGQGEDDGRCIIFEPIHLLPNNGKITVCVGPGVASKEGPLISKDTLKYQFYTVMPFKVETYPREVELNYYYYPRFSMSLSQPVDFTSLKVYFFY
jgi:hypothetical protein